LTAEERNKLENKAKEGLNGTVWEINLAEMASGEGAQSKKKETAETLYFENLQVRMQGMLDKGFNPTNYTIRLKGKDNAIIVWETMQTSEDKGIAFWRGQFEKGSKSMRGVLSWHLDENKKIDYSFKGTQKEIAPEVKPVAEAPAPTVAAEEAAVQEVPATAAEAGKEAVAQEKPPAQVPGKVEAPKKEAKPRPKWMFWRR